MRQARYVTSWRGQPMRSPSRIRGDIDAPDCSSRFFVEVAFHHAKNLCQPHVARILGPEHQRQARFVLLWSPKTVTSSIEAYPSSIVRFDESSRIHRAKVETVGNRLSSSHQR